MSDSYITREMRVRDLLCHRSGLSLGAGDLMLFPDSTLTVTEFLRHLRQVPIATSFRSQYAYDNVLYTVAGQVIERASGLPWNAFIRERMFQPLGMTGSRTSAQELKPGDDFAKPHSIVDGQLEEYPLASLGPAAPAGAINSSVQDLMKWVNMQLHEGEYPGGRLFSAQQSREMWTPHIFIPIASTWPPETAALRPNFQAYGLGWVIHDYHGERVIFHTGGLGGMVTRVTLVPAKKLGVVVLTNQEDGAAFQSVTLAVLDHYLHVSPHTDWVAAYSALEKRRARETEATVTKAAAQRNTSSRPSLPLAQYAGRYRDAWYGDIAISQESGGLAIRFSHSPRLTGKLEHFQYDTFIAHWNDRKLAADAYVTFAFKPDGAIRDVRMEPVSPATDFSFDFQDLDLQPIPAGTPPY